MPPLETRPTGSGQTPVTPPKPHVDVSKVDAQKVEVPKVEVRVEVHNHHDRMERAGGAGGGGGNPQAAASPRKTVGQRLGALTKGLLKGAAVLGLAAGLVVGGHYVVTDVAPKYLQQMELPVPGGIDNPALPGGQGPPGEIGPPAEIDPGPGVIRGPSLPTGETEPGGEAPRLPTHEAPRLPGTEIELPQLGTDPLKPDTIPADGGQTFGGTVVQPGAGTIQAPLQGIPGLTETDTPQSGIQTGPQIDPDKPPLIRQPLPDLQPADGANDPTTDPLKATLRSEVPVERLDTTRVQTFKPHMLRGGTLPQGQ